MERGSVLSYRGASPRLAPSVWLAPNASVIGDVCILAHSSVWFGCVVRGDEGPVTIGNNTNLQDGVIVHSNAGDAVSIGDNVTIGHGAIVHGCTIESGSLIGMGAVVLDGVFVESGVQVAAGAVVPPGKRLPSGTLWAGCPAKLVRRLEESSATALRRSAEGYRLKSRSYLNGDAAIVSENAC